MRSTIIFLFILLLIASISCDSPKKRTDNEVEYSEFEDKNKSKQEVTISPLEESPDFPDAIIEMNAPGQYSELELGKNEFSFEVKNFKLGQQTDHPLINDMANSQDGQHIHLILNNEPYMAHYSPNFNIDLKEGHYIALAFLSRSYHESVKTYGASVIRQFSVGNATQKEVDLTTPMLFYSRPKGEYKGAEANKILLDFYLLNTELSADGNRVRATINGKEFLIDKWLPYLVTGLPMGENVFKLELIDKQGKVIPGPYNSVERTITLVGPQL